MTPSHTVKKGVRYRYYISQRKSEGEKAIRVPAPDIESLVQAAVEERYGGIQADGEGTVLERYVRKVMVQTDAVVVEFADGEADEPGNLQSVSLPWRQPSFVALKGIAGAPVDGPQEPGKAGEAALTAIAKARGWLGELMDGGELAQIASREGKGERQIRLLLPLAFVSPQTVEAVACGSWTPVTVTELARSVPVLWRGQAPDEIS